MNQLKLPLKESQSMISAKQKAYIEQATTYHKPTEAKTRAYEAINQATAQFMEIVFIHCPESADRTDALRKIREARMVANASIACDGIQVPRDA